MRPPRRRSRRRGGPSPFPVRTLLAPALLALALPGVAQTTLAGRVLAPDSLPLPYATVQVLGEPTGTTTDDDGAFALEAPPGAERLVVRRVGYAQRLVALAGDAEAIVVVLESAAAALADVVVTAERTPDALADAPVAVTALPAERLAATRTWDVRDLTALVPGFVQSEVGVGWQAITSIRGVQVFSENPAVATYVDGVNYVDILAGGFPLVDVERVEVLRGPQGTLFGRNALGGVVNVVTRPPSDEPSGFAEASVGNLGLQRYAAGYRTPVVPGKLFVAASALVQRRDGYLVNDTSLLAAPPLAPDVDGARLGDESTAYGSARVLWRASGALDLGLDVKVQRDRSDASGFFVTAPTDSVARARPDAVGVRAVASHDRLAATAAFTARLALPGGARLSSVTTFQSIALGFDDVDAGGAVFASFRGAEVGARGEPQEVWTQELRATGRALGGRLDYTAGAYAFAQDAFEPTTNLLILEEFDPATDYNVLRNAGVNRGLAVYGQATYALAGGWEATAGLRYDLERRESRFNGFDPATFAYDETLTDGASAVARGDTAVEGSFAAVSPRVALAYALGGGARVHAGYTRGFRAGGVNPSRLRGDAPQTFDPETSDNYELGYRARLLDRRLRLGATAYWIEWRDLQFFELFPGFAFARRNVGDARSRGLELELEAAPARGLRADAALALTDTAYRGLAGFRGEEADVIGGNRLANAPTHTLALGAEVERPVARPGDEPLTLALRADLRQVGRQYTDLQNDLAVDPYAYLHARLALRWRAYSLALWGRNLGDARPLGYGSPDTDPLLGSRVALAAPPRTYGLTLRTEL